MEQVQLATHRVILGMSRADVRQLIRWALEESGSFSVIYDTDNGREITATAALADLIVLDTTLHEGSLICTLESLRSMGTRAPVIVLGDDVPYLKSALLAAGADAYFSHTPSLDDLVSSILGVLDNPEKRSSD